MARESNASGRSSLSFGFGFLGVIGALLYVAAENPLTLATAFLTFSLVVFAWIIQRSGYDTFETDRPESLDSRTVTVERPAPLWLIAPAFLATALAADRTLNAARGPVGWNVGIPWLVGLGLFALAAWWSTFGEWSRATLGGRHLADLRPSFRAWGPWAGMVAIAALPRFLWLDRFPTVIDADEGRYMLAAAEARTGAMVNPFSTGWFGVPNLYPAVQGWLTNVVGTDVAGHRMLGAMIGTIGVLATWRFGRLVVGPWPAMVGAVLLATLPFHLFFSRSALNHIADPTTLVLALLFLWRSVDTGRRGPAFVSGVMVGLGWYGYWGARIFPVIIVLLLAIAATDRQFGTRRAIRLGSWAAAGFLATTMPLLMSFVLNPAEFRSRVTIVSFFSLDGWRNEPGTLLPLFLGNLRQSLIFPLIGYNDLFFRHQAPFLGWPVAIALVVGVAVWINGLRRQRGLRIGAWLFVPWIVLALGIATTAPVQSQRFVAMMPFWLLAAGSGLVTVVRWLAALGLPAPNLARRMLIVAALLVISVVQLRWLASEDRQVTTFGDFRTTTAWDIGWRFAHGNTDEHQSPTVLFAGPPFMFADSWANLRVLAPDAVITDIAEPITTPRAVPPLPPGTMLILVAERSGERCPVTHAFPKATVAEIRAHDGALLYVAIFHEPLAGWSTATTPGETTFTTGAATPCG